MFKSILKFLKKEKTPNKVEPTGPLKFEYRIISKQIECKRATFDGVITKTDPTVLYSIRIKDLSGYTDWGEKERVIAYSDTYPLEQWDGFIFESLEEAEEHLKRFLACHAGGIVLSSRDIIQEVSTGVYEP